MTTPPSVLTIFIIYLLLQLVCPWCGWRPWGAAATMPGPLLATTMGVLEILRRRAENPITRVAMNIAAPADVGLSAP